MANELQTVRAALLGDSEAAAEIHQKHYASVLGALMNRGTAMQLTRSEVEECVGDLGSNAFEGTIPKPGFWRRFSVTGPCTAGLQIMVLSALSLTIRGKACKITFPATRRQRQL